MKLCKRSLLASFIAYMGFASLALAHSPIDNHLALNEGLNSTVIGLALKPEQVARSNHLYTQQAIALIEQLEYTPSLERRQTNLSQLAEQRQVQQLHGAEQLEALLSSTQVIDAVQQTIEPYGLTINNIADAYTLWWITAWQASEGELTPVDKQTAQAVKQQAVKIWLSNPKLAQASDANKQEITEALLVQALLTQAAINRSGEDAAAKQAVKQAVRQGAASSGLALEQMQLTSDGFVIKP